MSYSLLEMQETLRNIPMDGVQRVARGEHGKANQLLGMDEIKRRSEMSQEAQGQQAEQGVIQEPPMVDQYMQMAQAMSGRPPMHGPPGMGPPPGMALPMPQPGGPPMGPQMGSQRPPMPPQAPQMGAPAPPMGLAGLAPGGPPSMPVPGYDNGGVVESVRSGYGNYTKFLLERLRSLGLMSEEDYAAKMSELDPGYSPVIKEQQIAGDYDSPPISPGVINKIDNAIMSSGFGVGKKPGSGPVSEFSIGAAPDDANIWSLAERRSKMRPGAALRDSIIRYPKSQEPMEGVRDELKRMWDFSGASDISFSDVAETLVPPTDLQKARRMLEEIELSKREDKDREAPAWTGNLRADEQGYPTGPGVGRAIADFPPVAQEQLSPGGPDPLPKTKSEYDWNSPWSALMMAGLEMAAGESPDPFTNISRGAKRGVQDVMGRRVQERELKATEDLRKAQMDQARASLIRNQLDRPMKFEEYVDLHYPATERNTHDEGQRRRKIAELMTQYELYKSSIGRGYQILTGGDGIVGAHSLDLESGEIASG